MNGHKRAWVAAKGCEARCMHCWTSAMRLSRSWNLSPGGGCAGHMQIWNIFTKLLQIDSWSLRAMAWSDSVGNCPPHALHFDSKFKNQSALFWFGHSLLGQKSIELPLTPSVGMLCFSALSSIGFALSVRVHMWTTGWKGKNVNNYKQKPAAAGIANAEPIFFVMLFPELCCAFFCCPLLFCKRMNASASAAAHTSWASKELTFASSFK